MIVYFDTSALMPLVIEESSSPLCMDLWESADSVIAIRAAYVEGVAALAHASAEKNYVSTTR